MKNINLDTQSWSDYELLDSGNNKKLERFGNFTVIRPETQAIWRPFHSEKWESANAEFRFAEGKGAWRKKNIPEKWKLSWEEVRFVVRITSFKHIGVFPEQAPNWKWIGERAAKLKEPRVLNLFGHTGIAGIVAALKKARVTHVDASKQSNGWAKENAALSRAPENSIRYITDDALKFAEREARRGAKYDGIILDPPAFGRGPKGEVWKIEENLPRLLDALKKILGEKPGAFFLLNGYAAGYSPQSFLQAIQGSFSDQNGEFGELRIGETGSERYVPSGIYARFTR